MAGSPTHAAAENINLDFMRACAVAAVVGFHLTLLFDVHIPGPLSFHSLGYWGVLMFFVHTSLVLNLSLARQAELRPGQAMFVPFIVRRMFRVFPLSALFVLVIVAFGVPVGAISHSQFVAAQSSLPAVVSNLLLMQNLTHHASVLIPLWSLPYEMQMYLVLPALYVWTRRSRTITPLVLAWCVAMIPRARPWTFEAMGVPDIVEYVAYFVPGVIAFKLATRSGKRLPALLWPFALAGITALYLDQPSNVRGGVCCLLLGLAIPMFDEIRQPLLRRISKEIARYSYGIYLSHIVCMWLAFQVLDGMSAPWQWTVFVAALCALSVVLHHAVETPMIDLGKRCADLLAGQRKGRRASAD